MFDIKKFLPQLDFASGKKLIIPMLKEANAKSIIISLTEKDGKEDVELYPFETDVKKYFDESQNIIMALRDSLENSQKEISGLISEMEQLKDIEKKYEALLKEKK